MVDMLNGRFSREGSVVLMGRAWGDDVRFFIDDECKRKKYRSCDYLKGLWAISLSVLIPFSWK
jgi:hypothetical protein